MRERVALLGGSLSAEPNILGGFAVSAILPLTRGGVVTGDPISCLIADDQAMVREGFGALLAAQPDLTVVGQAADGADAVRLALELQPGRDPHGRPHAGDGRPRGDAPHPGARLRSSRRAC